MGKKVKENIYKKSPAEKAKLKHIKSNLSRPYNDELVVHFNCDRLPTDVLHRRQRSKRKEILQTV